jgi:hypothetical protein
MISSISSDSGVEAEEEAVARALIFSIKLAVEGGV